MRVDEEKGKVHNPIIINIRLDPSIAEILPLTRCSDYNLLCIPVEKDDETLFVIWDCESNMEQRNFSCDSEWRYGHGLHSRAGYIYATDYYVNLDTGIKNYYFEH